MTSNRRFGILQFTAVLKGRRRRRRKKIIKIKEVRNYLNYQFFLLIFFRL
uniref:Protein ENHANCED DISEASE RESISTANCE 2-like isoform X3 n=1 Tax=Rhizophora mucronata TaxID=61149 RepID=A0A2P2JHC0_RHIMU